MAATYAHGTAPLRRLADRYVVMAALAVANGKPVPEQTAAAFPKLPEVMKRADDTANQIERAVVDLAEVALLSAQTQRTFSAVVTDVDDRGARVQLCDLPVVARLDAQHLAPGDDSAGSCGVDRYSEPHREVRASGLIKRESRNRPRLRSTGRTARHPALR